ncbi:MAG: C39 family peptidase [Roseomonas sp.]|nr:C39 family peptidase [Roseomonas sp.]MCA3381126.1 C39 family peptidase [Roseomonas sp.]
MSAAETPPYFGQWESPGLIGDIIAGRSRAEDDPAWAESGAESPQDYARWADHLCGVACLRMALAARGITPPRARDLARVLTRYGAYVEEPSGFIRGLIYAPAILWLAEAHAMPAEIILDRAAEDIPRLLANGGLFIASVHPAMRRPSEPAPGKGGHLVLVFGAAGETLRLHNPSGHDAASQADARVPMPDFARFFAGRGIWLPGAPLAQGA